MNFCKIYIQILNTDSEYEILLPQARKTPPHRKELAMKKNPITKLVTVAAVAALVLGTAPKASAGHGGDVVAGIIGLAAVATVAAAVSAPPPPPPPPPVYAPAPVVYAPAPAVYAPPPPPPPRPVVIAPPPPPPRPAPHHAAPPRPAPPRGRHHGGGRPHLGHRP